MYDIIFLIEFLNHFGKSDYYSMENTYKVCPLTDKDHIRLEINYKEGLCDYADHIINLNDLIRYQRTKKLNKIVSNI